MKYQQLTSSHNCPYPEHAINPDKKNKAWGMQYARAAYWDWNYGSVKGVFSANGGDYQKYKMYAIGKQPIDQYKKI